jgi:Fic family protein
VVRFARPLLYLSLYPKQNRTACYDLLDRVRRSGDWEAWLAFFLDGVRQAAQGAVSTADLGLSRELTGRQRNRLFVYDRYLSILSEGTEEGLM